MISGCCCCYAGNITANVSVGATSVHPLEQSPQVGSYTECGRYQPGDVNLECGHPERGQSEYGHYQAGDGTLGPTVSVECNTQTRYIVVQLQATAAMSLCEVEVYTTGRPMSPTIAEASMYSYNEFKVVTRAVFRVLEHHRNFGSK